MAAKWPLLMHPSAGYPQANLLSQRAFLRFLRKNQTFGITPFPKLFLNSQERHSEI
jgi:hypothetical protein